MSSERDDAPATQWVKLPPTQSPTPPAQTPTPPRISNLKRTDPITPQNAFDLSRETSGETRYYRHKSENSRLLLVVGILGFAVILLLVALVSVTLLIF